MDERHIHPLLAYSSWVEANMHGGRVHPETSNYVLIYTDKPLATRIEPVAIVKALEPVAQRKGGAVTIAPPIIKQAVKPDGYWY